MGIGKKLKWARVSGKVYALNEQATQQFAQGDKGAAMQSLQQSLGLFDEFARTHFLQGQIHADSNEVQEAEAAFRKAIAVDAKFVEAYDELGRVLHRTGRVDEAEKSYRAAIAVDPQYAYAHMNLGVLQRDKGNFSDADQEFRLALASPKLDEETRAKLKEDLGL